jgi:hypothetical protein
VFYELRYIINVLHQSPLQVISMSHISIPLGLETITNICNVPVVSICPFHSQHTKLAVMMMRRCHLGALLGKSVFTVSSNIQACNVEIKLIVSLPWFICQQLFKVHTAQHCHTCGADHDSASSLYLLALQYLHILLACNCPNTCGGWMIMHSDALFEERSSTPLCGRNSPLTSDHACGEL